MNLKYNPKLSYSKFMDLKRNDLAWISKIPILLGGFSNPKLTQLLITQNWEKLLIRTIYTVTASETNFETLQGKQGNPMWFVVRKASPVVHPAPLLDELQQNSY